MSDDKLRAGDNLSEIWMPPATVGNNTFTPGTAIGYDGTKEIVLAYLPGPMGEYLVAVAKRDGKPDVIHPLHMAQTIVRAKAGT